MEKKSSILLLIIFLLVFVFLPTIFASAFNYFEIYNSYTDQSYPHLYANIPPVPTDNTETITAMNVYDVSGIYTIYAVVTDSSGKTKVVANMNLAENEISSDCRDSAKRCSYSVEIDTSDTSLYPSGIYTVDIVAIDNLLESSANSSEGIHKYEGTFGIKTLLLSADKMNPDAGEMVALTAQLSTLQNGDHVDFYSDGAKIGGLYTGASGAGLATLNYPFSVGTHVLTATDETYNLTSLPLTINVNPAAASNCATNTAKNATICISTQSPTINVPSLTPSIYLFEINGSSNSATISSGDTATLTAMIDLPIAGEEIDFIDQGAGGTPIAPPLTTDSTGLVSYTYTPSFTGMHTISAFFPGDPSNNLAPYTAQVQLSVSDTEGGCAFSNDAYVCITPTVESSGSPGPTNSPGYISYMNGYINSLLLAQAQITYYPGNNPNLNLSSGKIQRILATLSNGNCASYSLPTNLHTGYNDSPYTDTTLQNGKCYTYQYSINDNAENNFTYTSPNLIKVDTLAPNITGLYDITKSSQFTETATVSDTGSGLDASSYLWSTTAINNFSGTGATGVVTFGNLHGLSTTINVSGYSPQGTYIINFTAKDKAGNSAYRSFKLIWQ